MMWGCEDNIYNSEGLDNSDSEAIYLCDDGSSCISGGDSCADESECTEYYYDDGEFEILPLCYPSYDSNNNIIGCSEGCVIEDIGLLGCYYQSDIDVLYDIIDLNENHANTGNVSNDFSFFSSGWWVGRLFWLSIQNSGITALPESIENLPLLMVHLDNNQLTALPDSFCNLPVNWGAVTAENHKFFSISNNNLCPPYPECIEDYIGNQDCLE